MSSSGKVPDACLWQRSQMGSFGGSSKDALVKLLSHECFATKEAAAAGVAMYFNQGGQAHREAVDFPGCGWPTQCMLLDMSHFKDNGHSWSVDNAVFRRYVYMIFNSSD